jgi:hypothetical protein
LSLFHYRHRRSDFVDELIHANISNYYDSDALGSLYTTAQSKSSYLKLSKLETEKSMSEFILSKKFKICIHVINNADLPRANTCHQHQYQQQQTNKQTQTKQKKLDTS